jgi:hypothetical protein
LTDQGRREIARSCAVLDDSTGRLAFWTVTLSPAQWDEIEALDSMAAFSEAIRHRLHRALRRRGLRALVIGVWELHPKRSRDEGRPVPHLHVCFEARQHRKARWALSRERLDWIIVQALVAARVSDRALVANGQVQPVKKSVGRYLSHYMKKGGAPLAVCGRGFQLCPRQWWFRTAALKRLVGGLAVALPLRFIAWVHQNHGPLEWAELLWWAPVALPDARAPATYSVQWRGVSELAQAIARWHESEWEAEWRETFQLLHVLSRPRQHSQHDQHL